MKSSFFYIASAIIMVVMLVVSQPLDAEQVPLTNSGPQFLSDCEITELAVLNTSNNGDGKKKKKVHKTANKIKDGSKKAANKVADGTVKAADKVHEGGKKMKVKDKKKKSKDE